MKHSRWISLTSARRISQLFFWLLFVYILWSTTYPLSGFLPTDTFFKFNPLIMGATALSERAWLPGLPLALIMLAATLVLGRFFCGWICPMGTMIDAAGLLKKTQKPSRPSRLRWIKTGLLAGIIVAALTGLQIAWILDPLVIAARFVSMNLIPASTGLIEKLFQAMIRSLGLRGAVLDIYHSLNTGILGIKTTFFPGALPMFLFFLFILTTSLIHKRFWCRNICPLGALYSLFAKRSMLSRHVKPCRECHLCQTHCRMGAINQDLSYHREECILCMDCVYECPDRATRFAFQTTSNTQSQNIDSPASSSRSQSGMSRSAFLKLVAGSFFLLGFRSKTNRGIKPSGLIRPPGALVEKDFLDRCIRCGNCMKVCVTNGLQPGPIEAGISNIWTPYLRPEIGSCEYNCTLCGQVCPTGAIPKLPLARKQKTRLGLAHVNRSVCIPWTQSQQCLVCEEHCPVPDKAIKILEEFKDGQIILKPIVDSTLCIGCGLCQNKCPVRPIRAITVEGTPSDRSSPGDRGTGDWGTR